MTDLATDIANPTDESEFFITVHLKNGAGELVYDTRKIVSNEVYREALMLGLKVLSERAMSKITKEAYPDETQRRQAIHAQAERNQQAVYAGTVKLSSEKADKSTSAAAKRGPVMTEAKRIARELVKNVIKANKGKISNYKQSEITAAAVKLIEADPSIIEKAKANLESREQMPVTLNIMGMIHADPEKVAKDEAQKAERAAKSAAKPKAAKGAVPPRASKAKPGLQPNA